MSSVSDVGSSGDPGPHRPGAGRPSLAPAFAIAALILALSFTRPWWQELFATRQGVAAWFTVFVSLSLQALPFLVLGTVLSSAIAVLVPADALSRLLPRRSAAAVPVAGLAGVVLPGCECASVPIAGSLVDRGLKPAVAFAFLLAAPAINPIVLVSTAVAFNGDLRVVLARFVASLLISVIVGWIWLRLGRDDLIRMPRRHVHGGSRLAQLVAAARHDFLHAGGYLVLGAAIAATVNVALPTSWLTALGSNLVVAVLVLAVFAVVVAVCSEADAFVAASLNAFPATAQLVFMCVGPAVDVKLFSMQVGTFGRRFAVVFAPLTLGVAIVVAPIVGTVLL